MGNSKVFCRCTGCQTKWDSRESFLLDKFTALNGYQVNFQNLAVGWFLFTHKCASCNSTFSVPAGLFFDLYNGPIFTERKTETEECPEYCLQPANLQPCPAHCECAFVREVIQLILRTQKVHSKPAGKKLLGR